MTDIEREVLAEVRAHHDLDDLPDEAIERMGVYQRALFHERCLALGRTLRDSLPGPLRRLLGG